MQHTIWGRNGKKLEDDLFVDVDPINYEVWDPYPQIVAQLVLQCSVDGHSLLQLLCLLDGIDVEMRCKILNNFFHLVL